MSNKGHRHHTRGYLRTFAILERERRALDLYVEGDTYAEIARKLGVAPQTASKYIERALQSRAAAEGPTVEAAKVLYRDRLELLLRAWMPRAIGPYQPADWDMSELDPAQRAKYAQPDPKAAEYVLAVIDRLARLDGATTAKQVNVDVTVHNLPPQDLQARVLSDLAALAAKHRVIDGQLAGAGTSIGALAGADVEDKPAPPPTREAA